MAVISNSFGGLLLSDEEARKFRRMVRTGRPSVAARRAAQRGRAAAAQLAETGRTKVDIEG